MTADSGMFRVDFTGVGATPRVVGRCPDPECGGQLTGWLVDGCPVIQCTNISARVMRGRGRKDIS
jgi:hypothetical protein